MVVTCGGGDDFQWRKRLGGMAALETRLDVACEVPVGQCVPFDATPAGLRHYRVQFSRGKRGKTAHDKLIMDYRGAVMMRAGMARETWPRWSPISLG